MNIVVFHGPDNTAKYELLAWLRGPEIRADARTVGEVSPNSKGSVDDRVNDVIKWADKAIALLTPDGRSPYGAPNVIEEIGRWRSSNREADLAIVRDKSSTDLCSNLNGIVCLEYSARVNEIFLKLLSFMGVLPKDQLSIPTELRALPLRDVLSNLKGDGKDNVPIFIVVGGSSKYDPSGHQLRLKEYQSTEPITGVVRVSRALAQIAGTRFVDAVCDYSPLLRNTESVIDLIVVGGGDTNRIAKEIFEQDVSSLPVRFEPPTGSDTIITAQKGTNWSRPEVGFVLAVHRPFRNIRNAIVCAGNGARGTNAALTALAQFMNQSNSMDPSMASHGVVIEAREGLSPVILWP